MRGPKERSEAWEEASRAAQSFEPTAYQLGRLVHRRASLVRRLTPVFRSGEHICPAPTPSRPRLELMRPHSAAVYLLLRDVPEEAEKAGEFGALTLDPRHPAFERATTFQGLPDGSG